MALSFPEALGFAVEAAAGRDCVRWLYTTGEVDKLPEFRPVRLMVYPATDNPSASLWE